MTIDELYQEAREYLERHPDEDVQNSPWLEFADEWYYGSVSV